MTALRAEKMIDTTDRDHPCLFEAIRLDPTLSITPASKLDQVRDMQRWSRHWIFPIFRPMASLLVRIIVLIKRLLPFQVSAERILAWFVVSFLERVLSPEAEKFILRHFCIESDLINFIARNSGAKEGDVEIVDLRPMTGKDAGMWKGQNAIVRHDANLFNLFIDLGRAPHVDIENAKPLAELDFSDISEPHVEGTKRRRFLNLDVQTSLHLTILGLALCLDEKTAERALNSFQFDESLMVCLANLTGDPVFRTWTPFPFQTWLGSPTHDIARDLHWHMLLNEYAHTRLLKLAQKQKELA